MEKLAVEEQESIRLEAKQTDRVERSGQGELFTAAALAGPPSFEEERAAQHNEAMSRLRLLLRTEQRVAYEDALGVLLEMPLVWESDVQQIVTNMRKAGELDVQGLGPRERTVKAGHVLVSGSPRPR